MGRLGQKCVLERGMESVMDIEIVLPFCGADTQARVWAREERNIEFRREPQRAARCTMAYAAEELRAYLGRTLEDARLWITARPEPGCFSVCLEAESFTADSEGYELIPSENSLLIRGTGRIGVLYGAYELLKLQGWRWYEPGEQGEIVPSRRSRLVLPKQAVRFAPAAKLGRGFEFEGYLKQSEELLVWMARNRLNLAGYRPAVAPLMNKLGISGKEGGHIFEAILDPDRVMSSGKSLWEEHEEWFGTPEGQRKDKKNALRTQFCVTREDLTEFLCEELLYFIMKEWKGADRIDVWGFDTWGSVCSCENCRRLGNGTDQAFHFLSGVREYLDAARADGRLDHDVKLVMSVYEGTSTLLPPEKPVPQNLIAAGDYVVFCPIVRCYAHGVSDEKCSYNREYRDAFLGWEKGNVPLMVLEYYNVSKFEDLPLLFTERMKEDIPYYIRHGAKGFTYMHLPMVNWAMRTLTQVLYAELIWDPDADAEHIVEEYFSHRYGRYAEDMREVYRLIEEAWSLCTSWRAWKNRSLLTVLQSWDGKVPAEPLLVDDHFKTAEGFETAGEASEAMLTRGMEILNAVRKREREAADIPEWDDAMEAGFLVNPIELQKYQGNPGIARNLGEDKRLLIYGLDTLRLMRRLGSYYQALYQGEEVRAGQLWKEIELLEDKLESYYMPLTYERIELSSKDALTRTQLRDVIRRCRRFLILCSRAL